MQSSVILQNKPGTGIAVPGAGTKEYPRLDGITNSTTPATIKIYPQMGLASIATKHTGAWRLWALAKVLDTQGSSAVQTYELHNAAKAIKINPRCYRLWLADALELGLFIESGGRYWLTSVAKAAAKLGCPQIGRPAGVQLLSLFRKGWRAVLWAGYLATLGGRPVSQKVKQTITRVQPRTQRKYQRAIPIKHIENRTEVDAPRSAFNGLVEFDTRVIYASGDKLYQRLPDTLLVSSDFAQPLPRGRARKIQKQLITLSSMGRGNLHCVRLYYETETSAQSAAKRLRKIDDRYRPFEVFAHVVNKGDFNQWQAIRV